MALNTHVSVAESNRALLCQGLDELLEQPFDEKADVRFGRLRELLEALPLDTTEFGLAVNRLKNAQDYLENGEHGAGRFELSQLRRSLEERRNKQKTFSYWRCTTLSHAAVPLNHAGYVAIKRDEAQVLRDYMRKPQRHLLLHGHPLAAAIYSAERRATECETNCTTAIGLGLKFPELYFARAVARRSKGDLNAAGSDCEAALALAPEHAGLYNCRGLIRADTGRFDEALADFGRAIELSPEWLVPPGHAALLHEQTGALSLAVEDYSAAIRSSGALPPLVFATLSTGRDTFDA
jgi:tetratricopeptide (TPR) repeat protein